MLKRKQVVAVEAEATEGTAETLVAADGTMRVYDASFDATGIEKFERNPARTTLTPLKKVVGKRGAAMTWRTEIKGSGSTGTAPAWHDSLRASGFSVATVSAMTTTTPSATFQPMETITGSSSGATGRIVGEITASPVKFVVLTGTFNTDDTITGGTSAVTASVSNAAISGQGFEYTPESSDPVSATAALYEDGVVKKMKGSRFNVTIEANTGEPAFFAFDAQGVYDSTADAVLLSPTYETTVPPAFLSATGYMDGVNPVFASISLDMANTLAQRTSANAAAGILSVKISDRRPALSIDPEMVLVATLDYMGRMEAGTTGRFYTKFGATAGNKVTLAAPIIEYDDVGESDRDGISVAPLRFNLVGTETGAGDSEIQIAML